jgi:hypothetical protein
MPQLRGNEPILGLNKPRQRNQQGEVSEVKARS